MNCLQTAIGKASKPGKILARVEADEVCHNCVIFWRHFIQKHPLVEHGDSLTIDRRLTLHNDYWLYTRWPTKVSHRQESSLNRIKNRQCGYISRHFW